MQFPLSLLFFSLSQNQSKNKKLPPKHALEDINCRGWVDNRASNLLYVVVAGICCPSGVQQSVAKPYGVKSHNVVTMLFSPSESIDRPLFNLIESFQGCLGLPVVFSHHLERLLNATQAKFLVLFRAAVFVFLLSKALDFFTAISHTNKT